MSPVTGLLMCFVIRATRVGAFSYLNEVPVHPTVVCQHHFITVPDERMAAQFSVAKPNGFELCQRQWSSHILARSRWADQPRCSRAAVASA